MLVLIIVVIFQQSLQYDLLKFLFTLLKFTYFLSRSLSWLSSLYKELIELNIFI